MLPAIRLASEAVRGLAALQRQVDAQPDYRLRVSKGKELFRAHNRLNDGVFGPVRIALDRMSSGARRCGYCEDSAADEVDHFRPKEYYPESCFRWQNYVFACGPCNGAKRGNFSVKARNGRVVILGGRRPRATPPPQGLPLLLNPRTEDPMDLLELDLLGTFLFLPRPGLSALAKARAEYTTEILKLNARSLLPAARREAYANYRARLREYAKRRDDGAPQLELQMLGTAVRGMSHPAVWQEMKRQRVDIPALAELFDEVPEALRW